MIRSLIFPLLLATSALFACTFDEPTPGSSGGLIYDVEIDADSAASPPVLERRAGLVPHVSTENIVLSPKGGGYPRVTALSNDTLLGSYTTYSGNNRTLEVVHSTDGGHSFRPWGTIVRGTGNLDNAFLLQLRDGDVVAAYRNHDLGQGPDRKATKYRLSTSVSQDEGKTWKFLSEIAERTPKPQANGLWEPFLRLSSSGALQVYYSVENQNNDQDILLQTSMDNGKTWSTPSTVSGATTTGRDGMPGVANFNNGSEKLIPDLKLFSVKSVVSPDDGKTWGTRSQVHKPPGNGKNAAAPQIVAPPDGNLVVSFMTDEDTSDGKRAFKIVTGPPVATGKWGHGTKVTDPQSDWPGLFAKGDGSVLGCAGAPAGLICKNITFTAN